MVVLDNYRIWQLRLLINANNLALALEKQKIEKVLNF